MAILVIDKVFVKSNQGLIVVRNFKPSLGAQYQRPLSDRFPFLIHTNLTVGFGHLRQVGRPNCLNRKQRRLRGGLGIRLVFADLLPSDHCHNDEQRTVKQFTLVLIKPLGTFK